MPGLVPGIHVLERQYQKDVDGRDKPGHDDFLDKPTIRFPRSRMKASTRRYRFPALL
jgi:hypothetical protein